MGRSADLYAPSSEVVSANFFVGHFAYCPRVDRVSRTFKSTMSTLVGHVQREASVRRSLRGRQVQSCSIAEFIVVRNQLLESDISGETYMCI